ncbi:hypothetical protein [Chiayiivirga flava]|uniref:Uncharacterized protein n=1 Tax=Chiayiivirga flava TaxID=659595 RepID=A0A7W8D7X5_9GAMM|nr:hypothetical protein [Chiayiivirga flava]MBB5208425.1 hypothetical protein [Chiayiivirga flava]
MLKVLFHRLFGSDDTSTGSGPTITVVEGFPPERLVIPHDDHHGKLVGHSADGNGFFITTPYVADPDPAKAREFVALYRFAPDGDLIDAQIDAIGSRLEILGAARAGALPGNAAGPNPASQAVIDRHLAALGPVRLEDIVAKPFAIERHGLQFGLIPESADDYADFDDDEEIELSSVILMPGNYMAFTPPWTGDYDT